MKSARFLVVVLLLLQAATVTAQVFNRVSAGSPPIDSIRVSFSRAEKTIRVAGYVLDKASRQPVPTINVWWEGQPRRQARTDAKGHFVLYLPAHDYRKGQLINVQTLYYNGAAALPADTVHPVTVKLLLKRNIVRLKPCGCQPPTTVESTPFYATWPAVEQIGSTYAFLIRGTPDQALHKLRAITIRTGREGFSCAPVRLHIYPYNEQSNTPPDDDLLHENILVCPASAGVFTYDVSKYDIVVPRSGFFLAIEFISGSDKVFCYDPVIRYTPTGPILRPPCARADTRTWQSIGKSAWRRATEIENCWPFYENALSVEVEPVSAGR